MLSSLKILIVSENQLQAIGLRSILLDYFSPSSVTLSQAYDHRLAHSADVLFVSASVFFRHRLLFAPLRKKIVLLVENDENSPDFSSYRTLLVSASESTLIEKLEAIFTSLTTSAKQKEQEELSAREIEVLKLVARGYLNKEIADALSISLHTVISHRKNITRKLGIKTVPGLTLYALMNGLISSSDIH